MINAPPPTFTALPEKLALLGALTRSHVSLVERTAPGRLTRVAQSPLHPDVEEFLLHDREISAAKLPVAARAVDGRRIVWGPYGVMVGNTAIQEYAVPLPGSAPRVLLFSRSLHHQPMKGFIPGKFLALKKLHEMELFELITLPQLLLLPVSPFGLILFNEAGEAEFTSPLAQRLLKRVLGKETPREALLSEGFYESLGASLEPGSEGNIRQTTLRTPPTLCTLALIRKPTGEAWVTMTEHTENTIAAPAAELRQKMVQEIHHRVKNNFQMAASLLQLQARQHKDEPHIVEALKAAHARLNNMTVVYEFLSQEGTHAIHLPGLLRQLTSQLASHTWEKPAQVRVVCDIAYVQADAATRVAMVVSELVSNSLKHGPPDEPPKLEVTAVVVGQNVVISVSDNGPGPPMDFDLDTAKGLGLRIVRSIVEEDLSGVLSFSRREGHARFTVTIPRHALTHNKR